MTLHYVFQNASSPLGISHKGVFERLLAVIARVTVIRQRAVTGRRTTKQKQELWGMEEERGHSPEEGAKILGGKECEKR